MTVNATTIDMNMATGTFRAIGCMYGPIMPVMNNIGRNETITTRVADDDGRADFVHRGEHSFFAGSFFSPKCGRCSRRPRWGRPPPSPEPG